MALGRIQSAIVKTLVEMKLLEADASEKIMTLSHELTGNALDEILLKEHGLTEFRLLVAKSRVFGMNPVNVSRFHIDPGLLEKVPIEFCRDNNLLPLGMVGDFIVVAFANPFEINAVNEIQEKTGLRVVRLLAGSHELEQKLKKDSSNEKVQFGDVVDAIGAEFGDEHDVKAEDLEDEESGPIIQLANRIIEDAYKEGASDIHVEPGDKELLIRYRIDGVCQEKLHLPKKVAGAIVARFKIMSNLDIAERRLPQDGRIIFKQYTKKNIDIDLRVATSPLNHGEGVVMRILDKEKSTLPLPALGFSEENLLAYRKVIQQPYGMILHCGPTGSGKSMTLYSALNEINSPELVIRTAEDPIEYTLAGINQMQMSRQIGLTFASALRAFLRQDPDIVLVGEIRDKETANIAVEAALTGHLLLSTLHTNDAPGTVARLTDMGVEPFMISSSLLCVCAQRLMRRVCKKCRVAYDPEGRERDLIEAAIGWSGTIYKANPKGCPACNGLGYKGRVGIHELMQISDELIHAINAEKETAEIKRLAVKNGMKTLHQDSMLKVKDGLSTIEEALANVPPDL